MSVGAHNSFCLMSNARLLDDLVVIIEALFSLTYKRLSFRIVISFHYSSSPYFLPPEQPF